MPVVIATTTQILVLGILGGNAGASTGSLLAQGGGATPSKPLVTSAVCSLDQGLSCFSENTVRPGQPLLITGKNLGSDAEVVFRPIHSKNSKRARSRGRIAKSRAPTVIKASSAGNSKLEATVPKMNEGKYVVQVRNDSGLKSNAKPIKVLAEPKVRPSNTPKIVDAVTKYKRFSYGGDRKQAFVFQIASLRSAVPATVELVDVSSDAIVQQWGLSVATNRLTNVTWDGRLPDGNTAAEGRYQFRVQTSDDTGNIVTSTGMLAGRPAKGKAVFSFQKYVFPIQGPYTMGRGRGAGHDGVDVMAKTGTDLVAVTSGKIEYVGSHPRAGNYLILSGVDKKRYLYLHMNERPVVKKGEKVYAGQKVGSVGYTGNASASAPHLHFEVRAPSGSGKRSFYGRALDPKKFLLKIARQH